MRALVLALILGWAILSGAYSTKPLIFTFGVVSIGLVLWLSVRMDRAAGAAGWPSNAMSFWLRAVPYLPKLFWRMLTANIHVARLVLTPRIRIDPRLVLIDSSLQTELGKVTFATSITMTPGTVTLDVRDEQVLVHALDTPSLAGLDDGAIERDVARLEGGTD